MRILVVEDEPKVATFIRQGLEENGHEVLSAFDGPTGQRMALEEAVDLVLLDVVIPLMTGVEVCRAIRAAGGTMPILMLTALGTTEDKVNGLDAGADDYLVKPFEFQELLARIRSLTRRRPVVATQVERIVYHGLELDLAKREAVRDGKHIGLTAKEFTLLEYLLRNPERVHSRAELCQHVWDIDFDTGTNVVDAYIKLVRKKVDKDFEPKLIHTRVGMGYILTVRP